MELTTMNILELDTDCLYEIFSHLSIHDLVKVQRVCRKFEIIAEMHFKIIRRLDLRLRYIEFDIIDELLMSLGPHIQELSFHGGFLINSNMIMSVLRPIARYCRKLNLLELKYLTLNKEYIDVLKPQFRVIKILDIRNCSIEDEQYLCTTLKENTQHLHTLKGFTIN